MSRFLTKWGVEPDGAPFSTPSSELIPGIRRDIPVMLKLALTAEEQRGSALLHWWDGRGSAQVLEREAEAVLMVRAIGGRDLSAMAEAGEDESATDVLIATVGELHSAGSPQPTDGVPLLPLRSWFRELLQPGWSDPVIRAAAERADGLLSATTHEDERPLHGDIHHGNVLDFGGRWAVIDPKGLIGHRAFDFVNILCNPTPTLAAERLHRRLDQISRATGIDRESLSDWTVAWCGLSLVWESKGSDVSWHATAAREVAVRLIQ